ncbi:methionine/alanine import family NSS transporter small subunit [Virgibacillus halophilus]|uniref:Methionine/alanine import family NSS transporter small subunit n=1 Tax=Tigheibacillus halophilus TaxID=361280 RepID=A0ABU5C1T8_9BACI|nr:methionine/alanine import family NSS transporter small subunit [Virgibacillus halophilus]
MSGSAVVVMIIGILVIWGGLAASIVHAVKKSKESKFE